MRVFKKNLLALMIFCFAIESYATLPQAPNEVIKDNPDKEVTTVEALKNREHAELNITVNKVTEKEITGYELGDGSVILDIEEKLSQDNFTSGENLYYITTKIDRFEKLLNYKRGVGSSGIDYSSLIVGDGVEFSISDGILRLKSESKNEIYIGKLNKSKRQIDRIWKIKRSKDYKTEEVYAYNRGNDILLDVTEHDKLKETIRNKEIVFFSDTIKQKSTLKTSEVENNGEKITWAYFPRRLSEAMGLYRDEVEIDIVLPQNQENILYGYSKEGEEDIVYVVTSDGREYSEVKYNNIHFARLKNPEIIRNGSNYYLWMGNLVRVNRIRSTAIGEDGYLYYNFGIYRTEENSEINFKFKKNENEVLEKKLTIPYSDKYLNIDATYPTGEIALKSDYRDHSKRKDLSNFGLTYPEDFPNGKTYSWLMAFKVMFKLDKELYDQLKSGQYGYVENIEAINVKFRKFATNGNDADATQMLLGANVLNQKIQVTGEENINLKELKRNQSVLSTSIGTGRDDSYPLYLDSEIEIDNKKYKVADIIGKEYSVQFLNGVNIYAELSKNTIKSEAEQQQYNLYFYRHGESGDLKTVKDMKVYIDGEERYTMRYTIENTIFEVLTDQGTLDFGDFFPGDVKYTADTIKFLNFNEASININIQSTAYMTKESLNGVKEDQKIELKDLKVDKLNTANKYENSFRIRGGAYTTPTTEPGTYRGEVRVNVTIKPSEEAN